MNGSRTAGYLVVLAHRRSGRELKSQLRVPGARCQRGRPGSHTCRNCEPVTVCCCCGQPLGGGGGTADAQHTRPCSAWAARSPAPRGQPPKRSPSRRPRGHPAPSSWRVAWSCDRRPPPARERKGCGQAPRSLSGRHPSRHGARRHGAVRE